MHRERGLGHRNSQTLYGRDLPRPYRHLARRARTVGVRARSLSGLSCVRSNCSLPRLRAPPPRGQRQRRQADALERLRLAGVNRHDPGVGVRTAQQSRVQHARQDDVVDTLRLADNLVRGIVAWHREPDTTHITAGLHDGGRTLGPPWSIGMSRQSVCCGLRSGPAQPLSHCAGIARALTSCPSVGYPFPEQLLSQLP